jgi:hypothetical protein
MLNSSRICLLAFTTSSRHPRVRAETCSVTTAPNPELSIIGTSFKSKTMRPFFPQASSISIFSSGTFSVVNLPKHSTTQPSSTSRRCTRNPRAELALSFPAIPTLRSPACPHPSCLALYLISSTLPSALRLILLRTRGSAGFQFTLSPEGPARSRFFVGAGLAPPSWVAPHLLAATFTRPRTLVAQPFLAVLFALSIYVKLKPCSAKSSGSSSPS